MIISWLLGFNSLSRWLNWRGISLLFTHILLLLFILLSLFILFIVLSFYFFLFSLLFLLLLLFSLLLLHFFLLFFLWITAITFFFLHLIYGWWAISCCINISWISNNGLIFSDESLSSFILRLFFWSWEYIEYKEDNYYTTENNNNDNNSWFLSIIRLC